MKRFIYLFVLVLMSVGALGNASDRVDTPIEQPITYFDEQSGLTFVMEKLTQGNLRFWINYRNAMFRIGATHGKTQQIRQDYIQALKGFQSAIDAFKENEGEVWIAYATHDLNTDGYDKMAKIEICMTVTTSHNIPIVTHMGIFKTPLRDLSTETLQNAETIEPFQKFNIVEILKQVEKMGVLPSKPKLSLALHKFAAQSILHLYPDKEVMITAPLQVMYTMLKSVLGEEVKVINLEQITDFSTVKKTSSKKKEEKVRYTLKSGGVTFMELPDDIFQIAPWLNSVTMLLARNTKIAINLHTMAGFGETSTHSPKGHN
jgi:hypothetical protein